jgi:hypothetical protein
MGIRERLEQAEHTIDLPAIHGQPLGPPDGVDFVRVENRVYMRVVADNKIVATFRVRSHIALREIAANIITVADRMEILDRPKGGRGGT